MDPASDVIRRAAGVVSQVADQLADPARVDGVVRRGGDHLWQPDSLAAGYPALAALFAVLPGGEARQLAHRYLATAVRQRAAAGGGGVFSGNLALGYVALLATRSGGDYRSLRTAADAAAERAVARGVEQMAARSYPTGYDTIYGLSGVTRYLLATHHDRMLRKALAALASLARPCLVRGRRLPGWWVANGPDLGPDAAGFPHGHLNLGLSHGIAGPLAALSLALRAGVSVPGQGEAVETFARWLVDRVRQDDHGPFWPSYVTFEEEVGDMATVSPQTRAAWCYGTPGVARALQLASIALSEPAWGGLATAAMRSQLARPLDDWLIRDGSVCHGAAGLLHLTATIAADSADPVLRSRLPGLAEWVLGFLSAGTASGFLVPPSPGLPADSGPGEYRLGLLEGVSGIALALGQFAGVLDPGPDPALPWDAALLLR
jgi:lantibiotic biosynthesis protein